MDNHPQTHSESKTTSRAQDRPPVDHQKQAAQGQSHTATKDQFVRILSSSIRKSVLDELKSFTYRASDEGLDAVPETTWYWKGFAAKGAVTGLQGPQKAAGKTTFALHASKDMLQKQVFLGEPCISTPVMYLTEQNAATFLPTLKEIGLLGQPDFHFAYWHDLASFSWSNLIYGMVHVCQELGIGLLIIDTFAHFANLSGDSENDSGAVLQALKSLNEAASTGLSIVLIHHERKAGGEVWNAGRGSSALQGACDIVVSLRRMQGNANSAARQIQAIGRFPEIPDELIVELTDDGYVSHGTRSDVTAKKATEAALTVAPTDVDNALTADEMLQATQNICENVGKSTFKDKLKSLVEEGKLKCVGEGVKGDAYRYYKPVLNPFIQNTPL